jgi:hypothetical protein
VSSQTSPKAAKAQLVARFVPERFREAIPLIDPAQELHDLLSRLTPILFSPYSHIEVPRLIVKPNKTKKDWI